MEATILGTSCMVPTKDRNVSGLYFEYHGEGMLFDCGEGTQRQMNIAGINRNKVSRIFISHWHGDHVSGIIGLLQTVGNQKDNQGKTIHIFGPKETKLRMKHLLQTAIFDLKIELDIKEFDPKRITTVCETDRYLVKCAPMDHSIPCIGYVFIEKDRRRINTAYLHKLRIPEGPHLQKLADGKPITYKGVKVDVKKATYLVKGRRFAVIPDTSITPVAAQLAMDAEVMVIESTYCSEHEDRAEKHKHLTAKQAALIASEANVKKLILTHFSQRYDDTSHIEEEARTYFQNVVCAHDFMKIKW